MERKSKKTERLRPEVGPGATLDGLSLPQQDDSSEPAAVQKHQAALEAIHVIMEPCFTMIMNECDATQ